MRWTTRAVTLGLFLLGASEAGASLVAGATCTPGDPAIQADRYFITAGSVNYKAGASGLVTLYCHAAIDACPTGLWKLRLTYRDSDGAANAVSVTAQLVHLSSADGSFLGGVPGAQLLSNFSDVTVRTSQTTLPFTFFYDHTRAYHYVRVDMNRAPGTSHVATLYGVGLECAE
jgi:hypothetical protein